MPLLSTEGGKYERQRWTLESSAYLMSWGTLIFFNICFPRPVLPCCLPVHLPFVFLSSRFILIVYHFILLNYCVVRIWPSEQSCEANLIVPCKGRESACERGWSSLSKSGLAVVELGWCPGTQVLLQHTDHLAPCLSFSSDVLRLYRQLVQTWFWPLFNDFLNFLFFSSYFNNICFLNKEILILRADHDGYWGQTPRVSDNP